jgi:hypothetical protein
MLDCRFPLTQPNNIQQLHRQGAPLIQTGLPSCRCCGQQASHRRIGCRNDTSLADLGFDYCRLEARGPSAVANGRFYDIVTHRTTHGVSRSGVGSGRGSEANELKSAPAQWRASTKQVEPDCRDFAGPPR